MSISWLQKRIPARIFIRIPLLRSPNVSLTGGIPVTVRSRNPTEEGPYDDNDNYMNSRNLLFVYDSSILQVRLLEQMADSSPVNSYL